MFDLEDISPEIRNNGSRSPFHTHNLARRDVKFLTRLETTTIRRRRQIDHYDIIEERQDNAANFNIGITIEYFNASILEYSGTGKSQEVVCMLSSRGSEMSAEERKFVVR